MKTVKMSDKEYAEYKAWKETRKEEAVPDPRDEQTAKQLEKGVKDHLKKK